MIRGDDSDKTAALEAVRQLSGTPAGQGELIDGLAELSALTIRKADGDEVNAATLNAYASRLMDYPRSAALKALKAAPSRSKWFPTWYELEGICEQFMAPRRALLFALSATDKPARPAPVKSDASKAGFRDLAASLKGIKPQGSAA